MAGESAAGKASTCVDAATAGVETASATCVSVLGIEWKGICHGQDAKHQDGQNGKRNDDCALHGVIVLLLQK